MLLLTGLTPHGAYAGSSKTTPLLETARSLQCAASVDEANTALKQLETATIPESKVPNEWFGTTRTPQIHAATFDIVIDAVLGSINQYPQNTALAESVLLGWNYCEVHHSGKFFDLTYENGKQLSAPANTHTAFDWGGFENLGIAKNGKGRYIPKAFSNIDKSIRQQVVYDWWAIQRNQCLPHPGTGELYYKKTLYGPSKIAQKSESIGTDYPYDWTDDCSAPYTREEHKAYEIKIARELAEQEKIEKERAALALAQAQIEAEKRKQQLARIAIAQEHVQRERHAFQKDQHILEKQKADALLTAKLKREKDRIALRERARAFAQRKALEKEAAALEAIAISLAEQQYLLASQAPATHAPPLAAKKPLIVTPPKLTAIVAIKPPTNNTVKLIAEAAKVDSTVPTAPATPPVRTQEPPRLVTYTAKPQSTDSIPEVFIEEEPSLASALDATQQSSGKNLQSTPPQSTSTAFPNGSVPPFVEQSPKFEDRKYHGFSGSFALSNKGLDSESDAWSLTANFGYKPIRSSYFFARSGFTWKADDSDPTYYWGIGYNDWHTGTWAFELNHWGPLKPGDGLQLEKAVASISYKFDSPLLKQYGLSSSFSISGGENAAPAATLAGSWAPKPNWFVRTLITQPLEGGDTTWAYGFGYSDWRNKTWALEYNNWGTNKAFDLNFKENALVTLSWKWGF